MWVENVRVADEKVQFLVNEWQAICDDSPREIQHYLALLVEDLGPQLAEKFFAVMLKDAEAAAYFTHGEVQGRMELALRAWLRDVFSLVPGHGASEKVTIQYRVGAIHARLKIPLHLIAKGGRILKGELARHLLSTDLDRERLVQSTRYMGDVLDHALEVLEEAYLGGFEQQTRNDEAFRLFSAGQNMTAERERQRAALMEWFSRFMISLHESHGALKTPRLCMSEFGLWFKHKAFSLFQNSDEIEEILRLIEEVDEVLVRSVAALHGDPAHAREISRLVSQVGESINRIRYLSNWMFDQYLEVEHGRDPLTRLLNRRFLPSVLGREVSISLKTGRRFAAMMLDIDHFKHINDTHGHKVGDFALQQVAEIAKAGVRSSDFIFRYGGEEFLILLVEIEPEQALRVAETIRRKVEESPFRMGEELNLQVTVSIGIAVHDGHPDYEHVLGTADQALYRAKSSGRNRCVVYPSD